MGKKEDAIPQAKLFLLSNGRKNCKKILDSFPKSKTTTPRDKHAHNKRTNLFKRVEQGLLYVNEDEFGVGLTVHVADNRYLVVESFKAFPLVMETCASEKRYDAKESFKQCNCLTRRFIRC